MVFLKKIMLAASLLLASSFASAAVYDLDLTTGSTITLAPVVSFGGFAEEFNFTLTQEFKLDQDLLSIGSFSPLSFSVFEAAGGVALGTATMIGGLLSIDDLVLAAGSYTTVLSGDYGVGSLVLATSVSPVPEASVIAMMLGGLGLVGFMARRRKIA